MSDTQELEAFLGANPDIQHIYLLRRQTAAELDPRTRFPWGGL
jgi:hypothetical protein